MNTIFHEYGAVWHCSPAYRQQQAKQNRLGGQTSTIVNFLQLDVAQRNACLNRVYLVAFARRRETQPLSIEERHHVLSGDAFLGLPADVQSTAELDMAKSPDPVLGNRIELLVPLDKSSKRYAGTLPGWEIQDGPGGSMSFPAPI